MILKLEATDAGYKVPAETMIPAELIEVMLDEGHYVNVHSDAHPNISLANRPCTWGVTDFRRKT